MDSNKVIIILLVVIIAVLAVGLAMMISGPSKVGTELTVDAESSLSQGDTIEIRLTDSNGNPLGNQKVKVEFVDENNASSYYSVVTGEDGVGKLKLDKSEGSYIVHAVFEGDGKYNANDTSKQISIENEANTVQVSSSSSQSADSSSSEPTRQREDEKVTSDGWDPKEHEVSREAMEDGMERVNYDDGYFRIVDKDGNILSYGY